LKGAVLLGMPPETFSGGRVYPGYGSRRNARTYLVDCLQKNLAGFVPPSDDRDLVFGGWEALCENFANPVFFEKSPQLLSNWGGRSLFLEWFRATNLQVKILLLTRNPMSVQYSAFNLFHSDPHTRQFAWLDTQRNMLAFQQLLPAGMYLPLRYEDIVAQPGPRFAEICEFIGVPVREDVGQGIHDRSMDTWREDPFFTLQPALPVRQIALRFGYTEEDLENPGKMEIAPLRRVARKAGGALKLLRSGVYSRILKPLWLRLKGT
jgi:hypothetical protein